MDLIAGSAGLSQAMGSGPRHAPLSKPCAVMTGGHRLAAPVSRLNVVLLWADM